MEPRLAVEPLAAVRAAASVLAPPRCAICSRRCRAAETACEGCLAALARSTPRRVALAGGGEVHAAAVHAGVARGLVTALKFAGRTALGELAAEAIAERALPPGLDARCVVAVPPARQRLRSRGFDPAALVAGALAGRLGLPVVPGLARRDRGRQRGRRRAERVGDPPRFELLAPASGALLVDDVLTTGATLAACAGALRGGGCPPVAAAVFAYVR